MVDITRIREALRRLGVDADLVVVFGSRRPGTAGERSDVDIGVRATPATSVDWSMLEVELARAMGAEVDLVDLERAPPLLRFEVARDGVVAFEKVPGSWSAFKARAMVDWWDWKPTAERMERAPLDRLGTMRRDGPA